MINADKSIKVDGLEKSIVEKCKQRIIAIAVMFFVSFISRQSLSSSVSRPLICVLDKGKDIALNSTSLSNKGIVYALSLIRICRCRREI